MSVSSVFTFSRELTHALTLHSLTHLLATGDKLGDTFAVDVMERGAPVSIDAASVAAYFIRADGSTVVIQGTAEESGISVTLPESCYIVPGTFTLTIKATVGDARHALFACSGAVYQASTDALVDPGNVVPSLEELLAQIDRIEKAVAQAEEAADTAARVVKEAGQAAEKADEAAKLISGLTVTSHDVGPDEPATVEKSQSEGALKLDFGLRQGKTGEKGEPGATGSQGPAGESAGFGTFTVTVDGESGTPSGEITATGPDTKKDIALSLHGIKGNPGQTPQMSVTVETLGEDEAATASFSGPPETPTLNLGIPRGKTGKIENLPYASAAPKAPGEEGDAGTAETVARGDHVHPRQTDISGNAATADALKTPRILSLSGAVTGQTTFDGSGDAEITTTANFSAAAPKAPTASGSAGSAVTLARSDHAHPRQTDISGNAATADKLKEGRTITLSGAVTGEAAFDGSGDVEITTTSKAQFEKIAVSTSAWGPNLPESTERKATVTATLPLDPDTQCITVRPDTIGMSTEDYQTLMEAGLYVSKLSGQQITLTAVDGTNIKNVSFNIIVSIGG